VTAYVSPPVPTLTSTPTLFPFPPYSPSLCSTSNTNCSLTLETALLLRTLHTSRFRSSTPDIISYLSTTQLGWWSPVPHYTQQTCVRNHWFTLNAVLCSPQHNYGRTVARTLLRSTNMRCQSQLSPQPPLVR